MRRIALALVHYPVRDRSGAVVTTAVTNLDVHDIARSSHTYGVGDFFVVHPIAAQRELVTRITEHWIDGSGARRIPDRKPAMEVVRVVASLDDAIAQLGGDVELWTTSASGEDTLRFAAARERLVASGPPVLLCFGTGWGLAKELMDRAPVQLAPIVSPRPDGYNHLSVRAAAAIILDRLLGV
jgi:hypothetical protein